MKFRAIALLVLSLRNVFCGATLPGVAFFSAADAMLSQEGKAQQEAARTSFKHVVVSVGSFELSTVKPGSPGSQLDVSELDAMSVYVLDDEGIKGYLEDFPEEEARLYFICSEEAAGYVVKNEVRQVRFFEENCVRGSLWNGPSEPVGRRLMQRSEAEHPVPGKELEITESYIPDGDNESGAPEPCETAPEVVPQAASKRCQKKARKGRRMSSCCCPGDRPKGPKSGTPSIEDLLEESFLPELDGFDVSEAVQSGDGATEFDIQVEDLDSVFEEILVAMRNGDNPPADDYLSAELMEALRETRSETINRDVEVRNLREDEHGSCSESPGHTGDADLAGLQIRSEARGVSLFKMAARLMRRFVQTEEDEFKKYVSPEKTRLLLLSTYEFLLVYSTVEENLKQVVEIINAENGIPKLRSLLGRHVNFAAIKYVFKQYFAKYDHVQEKRVYEKSDFVRFMVNMNTNKLNPMQASPIFHLKLELAFMIIFYSKDWPSTLSAEEIEDQVNNPKWQQFYKDHVFFNFLIVRHFPSCVKSRSKRKLLKTIKEIILNNRRENPLDRPKICFLLVKQALLGHKISLEGAQDNELLKTICLKTYGLLGMQSALNRI